MHIDLSEFLEENLYWQFLNKIVYSQLSGSPRPPGEGPLSHWAKNRHGEILANRDARREFEDAWTESQYLSPLLGSAALRRAIYFFEK